MTRGLKNVRGNAGTRGMGNTSIALPIKCQIFYNRELVERKKNAKKDSRSTMGKTQLDLPVQKGILLKTPIEKATKEDEQHAMITDRDLNILDTAVEDFASRVEEFVQIIKKPIFDEKEQGKKESKLILLATAAFAAYGAVILGVMQELPLKVLVPFVLCSQLAALATQKVIEHMEKNHKGAEGQHKRNETE